MEVLHEIISLHLWPITIKLTILSLVILLFLVFFRNSKRKLEENEAKRKSEIQKILLIHLSSPLNNINKLILVEKNDFRYLAEISLDLLRKLRGQAYNQLVECLKSLKLNLWIHSHLQKKNLRKKTISITLSHHFSCSKTKTLLMKLLYSAHIKIHYEILKSLAKTNDYSTIPVILKEFQKKQDQYSIPLMSHILCYFDSMIVEYTAPLLKRNNTSEKVKAAIIQTILEKSAVERIKPYVNYYCHLDNRYLRFSGYLAIKALAVPPIQALEKGSEDPDWLNRIQIPKAAIKIHPFPIQLFSKLLCDANWLVSLETARVLVSTGPAGHKMLIALSEQCRKHSARIDGILAELTNEKKI